MYNENRPKPKSNQSMQYPRKTTPPHHCWAVLTACLTLTYLAQAEDPEITTQPTNQVVSLGGSVQFRVIATSADSPLTYQWQHTATNVPAGFTNLSGATKSLLTLSNVVSDLGGDYRVVVTNNMGNTATSEVANLTVDRTFLKITQGPIAEDREPSQVGSWCDYDSDGLPDLFVSNLTLAAPWPKDTLYHNEGNGVFTRITNALTAKAVNSWGTHWADYDNDGLPDAFLVHPKIFGPGAASQLFHNDGGGVFSQITWPLLANRSCLNAGWSDLDADGRVDLFITTTEGKSLAFGNLGDSRFQLLTSNEVGELAANGNDGFPSFGDFNNDGHTDLYVSGGSSPAELYQNQGGGRYQKVQLGSLPGTAPTICGVWGDFNNDGFLDLVTTFAGASAILHMSVTGSEFQDVTEAAGLSMPAGEVYGPAWGDYDNDGNLDLFIPYINGMNLLFRNNGDGTFTSVDVGSPLREGVNRECARFVDYDNDGFLDLFAACGAITPAPNLLYRNNLKEIGNANHWLKLILKGVASNRQGIGAKIRVRAVIRGREVWQLRQIASNGAFASGEELIAHFGLGDATKVDLVRIEWPSGIVQELTNVAVDQKPYLLVVETQNAASHPQILSSRRAPDGTFEATVKNTELKLIHVLEASTDLIKWTKIQVRTNLVGTMEFTDSSAANATTRFYRVVVP